MTDVAEGERRILVAVDEGEESMYALSWCLKNIVAQNSKDTLILLYAKPPRAVFTALDGTGYLFSSETWAAMEKYAADVADCVMEKAKKTCRNLRQDVKVETKVENGDPRDVVCQMAEQLRADVLVVGSHGYGGIKRKRIQGQLEQMKKKENPRHEPRGWNKNEKKERSRNVSGL